MSKITRKFEWTKGLPAEPGWYWQRRHESDEPIIVNYDPGIDDHNVRVWPFKDVPWGQCYGDMNADASYEHQPVKGWEP